MALLRLWLASQLFQIVYIFISNYNSVESAAVPTMTAAEVLPSDAKFIKTLTKFSHCEANPTHERARGNDDISLYSFSIFILLLIQIFKKIQKYQPKSFIHIIIFLNLNQQ